MVTTMAPLAQFSGFGPDLFVQAYAPDIPQRWQKLYEWWRDNIVFGLSPEAQSKMAYFFPGGEATRADHGHIRRGNRRDDQKWFIHVRPYDQEQRQLPILFNDLGDYIPDFELWYSGFLEWHGEVLAVWRDVYVIVQEFVRVNFSPELSSVILEQMNHPTALQKHVVRMIHYDPQEEGRELASSHKDYSLITADCLTTAPGLCLSKDERPLGPDLLLAEKEGHIVLFPGRKMHELTQGEIPGLCHGVISTQQAARGAVVCFFHGPGKMGPSCPD